MLAATCKITGDGKMGTSAYVTGDGGKTWKRVVLPAGAEKVSTGWDAIAYFDGDGNAYYGANDGDGLYITRSTDEGKTWSAATLLPGAQGFDRQYMGFDRTGRFAGRVYAGASVEALGLDGKSRSALAVTFSKDGAKTFDQPRLITSAPDERMFTFVNMVVAPDGTVILPFLTMAEKDLLGEESLFTPFDRDKPRPDYEMSLRVAVSGDGGMTYSVSPKVLTSRLSSNPARAMNAQGNGSTVIDLSDGPFRGRIYNVGLHNTGERYEVRVVHSSDNGKTWSKPVRVNDNAGPADHANPTIAVNNRGAVGVTWNDRRSHKNECYDLYFSASLDGGETFLPNVTPGGKPTCSMARGNWVPNAGVSAYPMTVDGESIEGQGFNVLMISTRFPGGGDTQGLDSDGDGVFHAAWIDGSSGVMQLATTPFTVAGSAGERKRVGRDVSTQVKLVSEDCAFDWKANAFSCRMHLENKSPLPVAGPFTVELVNMMVNLVNFRVDGSDNAKPAEGAQWSFSAPQGSPVLAPGAKTASRPFRWRFEGMPEKPEYPFMMFRVSAGTGEEPQ